jgi:hypothetical protein
VVVEYRIVLLGRWGTIQQFEDEYPDGKVPSLPSSPPVINRMGSLGSSFADNCVLSTSTDSTGLDKVQSAEEYIERWCREAN